MKLKPRDTDTRVIARRITAPETRIDPASGKKIALLSYIDAGSYQRHVPTTKELFLYAAGTQEEGEISDGLDRLMHHQFVIHLNKDKKAIGIDVIGSRLYRSSVKPVSQQDSVKTLIIRYDVGGAVARVTQRPFNTRFEHSAAAIRELDKILADGKQPAANMRLGDVGRVVSITDDSVEVRLDAKRRPARPEDSVDDLDDLDDLDSVEEDAVTVTENA